MSISKKLSGLVNYIEAVSFSGFGPRPFYQMSSFGENKTHGIMKTSQKAKHFVVYNSHNLSRIYPAGNRGDSSNLDPITPWNAGCQMGECWPNNMKFIFLCT